MLENPLNKKSAFTPLEIKRSHKRSHKFLTGFTLIELVTTVALVGAVFAAGITALLSIVRFYTTEQAKHRAADDLTLALNWIHRDAMRADDADTSDVAGNPHLELTITNYAVAGHPSVTVTYSLSAGNTTLTRTEDGATTQITTLIDPANEPNYDFGPADGYPQNYLFVEMHTIDGDNVAHQRMGVMLCEAPP